ncbi:MAG: energy transducer TonB [Prevotella sp.]|nr:energy transducer TonB [Prevotella sp.]
MAKIDLYDPKWVDMVFAGKNQDYGAYKLRMETSKRNIWALVILLSTALLIGLGLVAKIQADKAAEERQAYMDQLELSKLQEQAKQEKKEEKIIKAKVEVKKVVEQVRETQKFTAPEIKKDELVNEENQVKDQADLDEKVAVGVKDQEGTKDRTDVAIRNDIAVNTNESEEKKEVAQKIFDVVEQQPQFPGNLNQYLRDHINYPTIAQENGIQGKVIVQFVVERDGSITQVNVIRGVDPSLDKEAVRVVKSMPKWTPGKQNGQAVRVKFTLPVNFKLG